MGKKRKKKKVLLSGSDPFYLSKKLRRRRYGEVSAQTPQKSQNRALVKKKVAYRAPAAQACTPPTWTINRIFSKSEILAESLNKKQNKKKKCRSRVFKESVMLPLPRSEKVYSGLSKTKKTEQVFGVFFSPGKLAIHINFAKKKKIRHLVCHMCFFLPRLVVTCL